MAEWREFLIAAEDSLSFGVLVLLSIYMQDAHPIPGCALMCAMTLLLFGWDIWIVLMYGTVCTALLFSHPRHRCLTHGLHAMSNTCTRCEADRTTGN